MKNVFIALLVLFSVSAFADDDGPEDEVVTQKEFEAHQKKQKAEDKKKRVKTPDILPSLDLVQNAQKKAGSVFRVMILSGGLMGIKAKKKGGCDFQYLILDDGGFGSITGHGNYAFEIAPKDWKICQRVSDAAEDDISSVTLVVQFTALLDGHNAVGGKITLPVMTVQKVD